MKSRVVVLLLVATGGCGEQGVGNEQPSQDARTLDGFTYVSNTGSLDVRVTQGATFAVVVNADTNIAPIITTTVSNGVLSIASTHPFISKDPTFIDVTLPSFVGGENIGSGSLSVRAADTQDIGLKNRGSGELSFLGQAGVVSIDLAGSGTTTLTGFGARLSGSSSGSGTLDAAHFQVNQATVALIGSGSASLAVSGDATLAVSGSANIQAVLNDGTARFATAGSGSIDWTGNSTVMNSSIRGSGTITSH